MTRTHAWGDGAFVWAAPPLACAPPVGDRGSRSVHADGALVAWDATGAVCAVLSRGVAAEAAVFLPESCAFVVLRRATLERLEVDGVQCWSRALAGSGTLLVSSDEHTVAIAPSWGFAVCHAFDAATGAWRESSSGTERWLALGPGATRVSVVERVASESRVVASHDADGNPSYEPGRPPTYELRIEARGDVVARWPVDATRANGARASVDRDGARAIVSLWDPDERRDSHEAIELATGVRTPLELVARPAAEVRSPSTRALRTIDVALAEEGTHVAWCAAPRTEVSWDARTEVVVASVEDASIARITVARGSRIVLAEDGLSGEEELLVSCDPVVAWRWRGGDVATRSDLPREAPPWRVSSSGRLLLLGAPGHTQLQVCERANGNAVRATSYSQGIHDARFEADESALVVAHGANVSRLDVEHLSWRWTWQLPHERSCEGSSEDGLAVVLGPGVALVADRGARAGRLRVIAMPAGERTAIERMELRRWSSEDPSGEPLLAISADGAVGLDATEGLAEIRVWDLVNGELLGEVSLAVEHDLPTCVALAAEGASFVVGTGRGRTLRYRVERR